MGKRRRGRGRAAAQQSSDDGESSGDESVSGVWELDVEELRGRLAAQPKLTPEPEIEDAKASIADKEPRRAIDAISANGCCQCFTVHMCLAVFGLLTAGLLLTAVGAGTAPHLTPANVFQTYQGVEECVMLLNGDLIPASKWSGDPKELSKFSREKIEARMEKAKELEPEEEPEPEPSGEEEAGAFECQDCGRRFDTQQGVNSHKQFCTGAIEEGDYEAETAAARAFLGDLGLKFGEIADAANIGDVDGVSETAGADRLLDKVHAEVAGLKGAKLGAKLRTVDVALATAASDAQRRDAYVLARVKRLVEPVLLARTYFWKNGEFQRLRCQAYVQGLGKGRSKNKSTRLRSMIKDVSGTPASKSLSNNDALEAALVEAYEAKTPEVAEESKYNPFAAPKIKEVIEKHGVALRGDAGDAAVLEAVAKTATSLLQQTKGGFMATNGSVVYVQTLWLLRLILDGRVVRKDREETGKIFERFKADDEGKREGYTVADGWRSAAGLKPGERVHYSHSAPFDEALHTRGEIVYGGNGTNGRTVVCFIIEGRKYFVLFCGREDYVLVNEVSMDCLAFVAATVVPIVLAETSSRPGDENYDALSSDKLPRIKDILASELGEHYNRGNFRNKWKNMTGFFDGFFALVLLAILHKGGTITEAPGRLSAVAGGVPKQGRRGSEDGPEDGFHFDEGQVRNLILRLKGGGSGMCGGRSGRDGRDSDDDDGGTGPGMSGSGRGRAKRPKYDPFEGLDPWTPWNTNQVLVGVDGPGDGSGAG